MIFLEENFIGAQDPRWANKSGLTVQRSGSSKVVLYSPVEGNDLLPQGYFN
jgi:hypothetical protein